MQLAYIIIRCAYNIQARGVRARACLYRTYTYTYIYVFAARSSGARTCARGERASELARSPRDIACVYHYLCARTKWDGFDIETMEFTIIRVVKHRESRALLLPYSICNPVQRCHLATVLRDGVS